MRTKLTDLCSIQYGYAFDSDNFTEDTQYLPLVRIRDVKRGFSETFYSGEYPAQYVIHTDDLLIGMDGEFNIARWKSGDALLNQRVCKVAAKPGTNEEYLRFALIGALKEIEARTAFVTVKHLSAKELNKLVLDVPPYEKQKQIATILGKIERVIGQRDGELSLLDELIKARFVEMFGDPETNPYGYETKLGEDVFKLSNGKFVPEDKRFQSGTPVYGGNGISWYTDEILYDNDTIVVGRVGFQSGNVHFVKGPLYISDNAMYICNLFDDGYILQFLFYLMEHINFTRFQDAGDLKKITQKPFMKYSYIKPPVEIQQKYISFVEQTKKTKAAVQKALDEAQVLFDSLMQEYFG